MKHVEGFEGEGVLLFLLPFMFSSSYLFFVVVDEGVFMD
jgi:hypothetical protein